MKKFLVSLLTVVGIAVGVTADRLGIEIVFTLEEVAPTLLRGLLLVLLVVQVGCVVYLLGRGLLGWLIVAIFVYWRCFSPWAGKGMF